MNNGTNDVARNIGLICVAAFLRSMSTGTLGVVLAVYLSRNGLSATWIGAVIASGLAACAIVSDCRCVAACARSPSRDGRPHTAILHCCDGTTARARLRKWNHKPHANRILVRDVLRGRSINAVRG